MGKLGIAILFIGLPGIGYLIARQLLFRVYRVEGAIRYLYHGTGCCADEDQDAVISICWEEEHV